MPKKVSVTVNGKEVKVNEGTTILEASRQAGYEIPTLCYLKEVNDDTNCRICVVEVKGARNMVASCQAVVYDGMEIKTNTPKVRANRKMTIELILSNHERKCLSCPRSTNCELQKLALDYGCDEEKFKGEVLKFDIKGKDGTIVRDNNKCVLCRRCIAVCRDVQQIGVLGANARGFKTYVSCAFDKELNEVPCVACGQCVAVCPVAAIAERDDTKKATAFIADPGLHVIVGTAPAVRVALGESFGLSVGTDVEGKMVAALKNLGFDKVFDINLTADLTIMEEGAELLERLNDPDAVLPMITSCSPGWVNHAELAYPELIKNLSSCKSPQQMFGAIMKTYYAKKMGIDVSKIKVVTIMPCIAKKDEAVRDNQAASGYADIDAVLTTRELAKMISEAGIDFNGLKNENFDDPMGKASTAGLIFGATGGVMEASLRTVSEIVEGKPLSKIDFTAVRGTKGVKTAEVKIGDKNLRICVISGLGNAKPILDEIKQGNSPYHFIEIMACPGGCVTGGGQPVRPSSLQNQLSLKEARAKTIYAKDKKSKLRKSHDNPLIKEIYNEYLDKPGSHKAHEILHTSYSKKDKYK